MGISAHTAFLIVDDYDSIRKAIKQQLTGFGFKGPFFESENPNHAIKILEGQLAVNSPIHFIISDWNMPEMTGFQFLEWVRANNNFKDMPFLLLTTVNEQDKVLDAIQAGADNYLIKPWGPEDLKTKVAQVWKKRNAPKK